MIQTELIEPRHKDAFDWIVESWKTAEKKAPNGLPIQPFLDGEVHPEVIDNVIVFQFDPTKRSLPFRFIGKNFTHFPVDDYMGHDLLHYIPEEDHEIHFRSTATLHKHKCAGMALGTYQINTDLVFLMFKLYLPIMSATLQPQTWSWFNQVRVIEDSEKVEGFKIDPFRQSRFLDLGFGVPDNAQTAKDLLTL